MWMIILSFTIIEDFMKHWGIENQWMCIGRVALNQEKAKAF